MCRVTQLTGGEIASYTQLLTESREEAMERMVTTAEEKGANAIIGIKVGAVELVRLPFS